MLINKNITVGAHRTSIRLEPEIAAALADIAQREDLTVSQLCTEIDHGAGELSRTAAIRVFVVSYMTRLPFPPSEPVHWPYTAADIESLERERSGNLEPARIGNLDSEQIGEYLIRGSRYQQKRRLAAYAKLGRFEEAANQQQCAIASAKAANALDEVEALGSRLDLYRRRLPNRE